MKAWLAVVGLLAVGCAVAQDKPKPEPLKCAPYQHVYSSGFQSSCTSAPECKDKPTCGIMVCVPSPSDRCEDDMHPMKESEYQAIMKRTDKPPDLEEISEHEWHLLMKRLGELENRLATLEHPVVSGTASREWPEISSMQIVLDPIQAKTKGNEKVKQCGPANHDGVCFDPAMPHITNRIFIEKAHCEAHEGVICTHITEGWVPVGKPVFYDESPPTMQFSTAPACDPSDGPALPNVPKCKKRSK